MDKTVEIVMVVMVALATAAILLFLLQGRAGGFSSFLDDESQSGKCSLWASQENPPSEFQSCPQASSSSDSTSDGFTPGGPNDGPCDGRGLEAGYC